MNAAPSICNVVVLDGVSARRAAAITQANGNVEVGEGEAIDVGGVGVGVQTIRIGCGGDGCAVECNGVIVGREGDGFGRNLWQLSQQIYRAAYCKQNITVATTVVCLRDGSPQRTSTVVIGVGHQNNSAICFSRMHQHTPQNRE